MTNKFRILPSFLIIGAAKSGTTSLYAHLIEHPNIIPASMKEVQFFQYLRNTKTSFYRSHFPIKRKNLITGEATASYFPHPFVPARVHKLLPLVKLIVILRNPVERAYSSFHYKVKLGEQIAENFEDAIKTELKRIEIENTKPEFKIGNAKYDHPSFSYLRHGLYAQHLEKWLKFFPKEQLLIIHTKEFQNNTEITLAKTFDFLGLPKYKIKSVDKKKIRKIFSRGGYESDVTQKTGSRTQTLFNEQNYPEMKSETKKFLCNFFKPHNEKLFKIIEKRFDWNDEK